MTSKQGLCGDFVEIHEMHVRHWIEPEKFASMLKAEGAIILRVTRDTVTYSYDKRAEAPND